MTRYLLKRLLLLVTVLLGVSVLVFTVVHMIPGDLVDLLLGTEGGSPEQVAALRQQYGLDQPIVVQYLRWLGMVLTGNLGTSPVSGRPVLQDILAAMPITLEIAMLTMVLSVLVGIPLGVLLSANKNSRTDVAIRLLTLTGMSVPSFVLGMLAILYTSLHLPSLYTLGFTTLAQGLWPHLRSVFLPTLAMAVPVGAIITRVTRACMLDVLREDYIRTAKAKGMNDRRVLYRHALKNAMIPTLTVIAFQFGYLLGGAVVVEEVFSLPGLGRLVYTSVTMRDYPLLQGGVLAIALGFVLINLVVDIGYAYLDPRIHYQ